MAISPTLDPGIFAEQAKALGADHHAVEQAQRALTLARDRMEKLSAAERAIAADPTLSDSAKAATSFELREKIAGEVKQAIDRGYSHVRDSLEGYEDDVRTRMTPTTRNADPAEIRAFVRAIKTSEKMAFIHARAAEGDVESLAAIFDGAPGYLVGVANSDLGVMREAALRALDPTLAAERDAVRVIESRLRDAAKVISVEFAAPRGGESAKAAATRKAAVDAASTAPEGA